MADSNQTVAATLQIDASSADTAGRSIKALKDNVKELQTQFEGTKTGSAEQAAAFKQLKAAQDDLAKSTAAVNDTFEKSQGSFSKLKGQMDSLPGPLKAAGAGVGELGTAFEALLANPVVLVLTAIVAVLATLYKAFTNSFEGGEKMEQVFAGIKAGAQAVFDNIAKIAGAIVKFFAWDFSGAIADIKGVVSSVADAYSAMAKLTQQAQDLHKQQLTQDLDQAKRAKDLAVLREQASDETIPIAKRKAALLELQKASQDGANKEIALTKAITDNKIAQLTLQKEGEKKNQDEITQLRVDELNKETEAANEQRRIAKQITLANKQELAERKAEADKARADAKAARQEQIDYFNKLQKIQQDTELAGITDTYAKEKKQLDNKIADDKAVNDLAFEDKKITKAQHDAISQALDAQAQAQRGALADKHNLDVQQKEIAFQKDLQAILAKTKEDAQANTRAAEKLKLQSDHDQRLADAEKTYKDDATKFQIIKRALDDELKAEQAALDAKNQKEDATKKLKVQEEQQKKIIDDRKASYADRQKAVNDEQALVQAAFDNKVITELDYNTKVDALAKARQAIHDEEQKNTERVASAIGSTFGNLASLVGKQTVLGKTFAIAQATIDTYGSAVKAYSAMADIPVIGPALGIVAAAAAIAAGVENVKKIVAVNVPGQGSGGGSVPTASTAAAPAPIAPTQQSTSLNQNSINAIGNATSGRSYVLSGDISNDADRNARLNRAARLGG